MQKVEHIGIAVRSLPEAVALYTRLLGVEPYKTETVESELVTTVFFQVGETKIELLEATQPESVIARYIEKKGEGMHHIAYEVDNIYAAMERMQKEGFTLLHSIPKKGADNKLVCFLHPKSAGGTLIELCQEIR